MAQDPTILSANPATMQSASVQFPGDQHVISMIPTPLTNLLSDTSNTVQASNFKQAVDYEANMKALLEIHGSQQLDLQTSTSPGLSLMEPLLQGHSMNSFQQPLGSTAGNKSAVTKEVQNLGIVQFSSRQQDENAGLLDSLSEDTELLKILRQEKPTSIDENKLLGMLAQNNTNPLWANPYCQAPSAPRIPPAFLPNLASRDQGRYTSQGQDTRSKYLLDARKKQISVNMNFPPHDPVDLYMKCDDNVLSDYQILLRKQIEFFEAGPAEVHAVSCSRRKPIFQGQIGIRCKHCSILPPLDQPKGTVYYPSYLRALYQAGQNMATSHFLVSCELINKDVKKKLMAYREGQASVGYGGKKYWEDCARAVGILEPKEGGLRFRKSHDF